MKHPAFDGVNLPRSKILIRDRRGPKGPLPPKDNVWWRQVPRVVNDYAQKFGICQLNELVGPTGLRPEIVSAFHLVVRENKNPTPQVPYGYIASVDPAVVNENYRQYCKRLTFGQARYIPRRQWGLKGSRSYRDAHGPYLVGNTSNALRFQHKAAIASDALGSLLSYLEQSPSPPPKGTWKVLSDALYWLRPDEGGAQFGTEWLKTLHYRVRKCRRLSRRQ